MNELHKPMIWHSAQQLDNLSPDIIYQGNRRLERPKDSQERQKVVSKIDEIISSYNYKKMSKSSKVSVYCTFSNFVIKSIPEERDGYGRLAPILSYGNFPNVEMSSNQRAIWIQEVCDEIAKFSRVIQLTISEDTQEVINKLLREAIEDMHQKTIFNDIWQELSIVGITLGVAIVTPVVLGIMIHQQIYQFLKPLEHQNLQQILTMNLQEIIQVIIIWLTLIITVNNAILVLIIKIPSLLKIRHYYKMKKMMSESKL